MPWQGTEESRAFWTAHYVEWRDRVYSNVTEEVVNFGACITRVSATVDCRELTRCDCGGTMDIQTCNALPDRRSFRRHMITRPCPGRLARQRTVRAAASRRWRATNPDKARERTRQYVAAHRARQKENDATTQE